MTEDGGGGKWKIEQCSVGPETATAMMLSLGIKTHTNYTRIDVMSSDCSSQSRIPFIYKSHLLQLAESSPCSGTSSPPSIPETFLERR